MKYIVFASLIFVFFAACSTTGTTDDALEFEFDFNPGLEGWQGGFADYPAGDDLELLFDRSPLPVPLDSDEFALKIGGTNTSDDLFMFVKKRLDGFTPNTLFSISFEIELASNAPEESVGIGGSPGSSVYLKAGAVSYEPMALLVEDPTFDEGYFEMNVDKGGQSQGGEDVVLLGNIGHDGSEFEYTLIRRISPEPLMATTNDDGELWIFAGTDSAFEGRTVLFYNNIKVTAKPQS